MAKAFSEDEWNKIFALLKSSGQSKYGLPARRRDSVVIGSFNIRKLGAKAKRSEQSWRFLGEACKQFDLLAIQEVQDDLEGLKYLQEDLLGGRYGLVASDITGSYPGQRPAPERLAFLFRWDRVQRTEIASDITYDRSKVLGTLYGDRMEFWQSFDAHTQRLAEFAAGARKTKPTLKLPKFLTFIRQPLCVSFKVGGGDGVEPYEFLAVSAHLLYGTNAIEREWEFNALVSWMVDRAKQVKKIYHKNLILLGDLNLNFEETDERREVIESYLKSLNGGGLTGTGTEINFPFLDTHPGQSDPYRTNARLSQTYDQVGLLSHDQRLPKHSANQRAGKEGANGYDYGVFNFASLFADALGLKPIPEMAKRTRTSFFRKFEHDVSDHMPLWIRLPKPS